MSCGRSWICCLKTLYRRVQENGFDMPRITDGGQSRHHYEKEGFEPTLWCSAFEKGFAERLIEDAVSEEILKKTKVRLGDIYLNRC